MANSGKKRHHPPQTRILYSFCHVFFNLAQLCARLFINQVNVASEKKVSSTRNLIVDVT